MNFAGNVQLQPSGRQARKRVIHLLANSEVALWRLSLIFVTNPCLWYLVQLQPSTAVDGRIPSKPGGGLRSTADAVDLAGDEGHEKYESPST